MEGNIDSSYLHHLVEEGKLQGIFPGWGESRVLLLNYDKSKVVADTSKEIEVEESYNQLDKVSTKGKLNTALALSIAGCDLMGSTFYTVGLCIERAGKVIYIILFSALILPNSCTISSLQ
jgi:hypothetical protein